MKRKILLFLLSLFVSFNVFSLDNIKEINMTVLSITNKLEYKYINGDTPSKWTKSKPGDKYHKGVVVQTGFRSDALLAIDESKILLGSTSRITLEQAIQEINSKDENVQLFLNLGKSYNYVNRPTTKSKINFTVTTPYATASVRGTEFILWSKGTIKVIKGNVEFGSSDRKKAVIQNNIVDNPPPKDRFVDVGAGFFSNIEKNKPIEPKEFNEPPSDPNKVRREFDIEIQPGWDDDSKIEPPDDGNKNYVLRPDSPDPKDHRRDPPNRNRQRREPSREATVPGITDRPKDGPKPHEPPHEPPKK